MIKFEIIDIGKRDAFYSDRKIFIGKTLIVSSKQEKEISPWNDEFCGIDGKIIPSPISGIGETYCFYAVQLKEIK